MLLPIVLLPTESDKLFRPPRFQNIHRLLAPALTSGAPEHMLGQLAVQAEEAYSHAIRVGIVQCV
jgi:hypothetical protein